MSMTNVNAVTPNFDTSESVTAPESNHPRTYSFELDIAFIVEQVVYAHCFDAKNLSPLFDTKRTRRVKFMQTALRTK